MSTAELKSVRLHYEVTGAARGDVLVLVNSISADIRMWRKLLPRLEQEFTVIRFDARGHGWTPVTPGHYSIDELGEDLLCLLDKLHVSRVNICGVSLGGLIAMWVGINAPHRVRRLVLANTAARIGTAELWEKRIETVRHSGMLPQATAAVGRWFTPTYRDGHPTEMQFIREMVAATHADSYIACCAALRDTDLRFAISSIAQPCLVIAGSQDASTTPAEGRALQMALRNSAYVEVNASHLSPWEAHKDFGNAALAFFSDKG